MPESEESFENVVNERLRSMLRDRGISLKEASEMLGHGESWLSGLISREAVVDLCQAAILAKKASASLDDLVRVRGQQEPRGRAEILKDSVSYLRESRGFDRPTVLSVIQWHTRHKGRLKDYDWFRDYVEIFHRPDEENVMPLPAHLGRLSLTATEMRISDINELMSFFSMSSEAIRASVVESHHKVLTTEEPMLTPHSINFDYGLGIVLRLDYLRFLAPVTTSNGEALVLNYSVPTRREETITGDVTVERQISVKPNHGVVASRE